MVGGVGLAALGVAFVSGLCESQSGCQHDLQTATFGGLLVGAGAGALLGAGIGLLTDHWERRYP